MQKQKSKCSGAGGRLLLLPPERIRPNPAQPRRSFDREGLQELAASIAQHGLLQPISVRRQGEVYELISGERRLRAAKLAGLTEIPCLLLTLDEEQSGILALVENLQRQDLNYWEEAEGIARLMQLCHLRQEEAAAQLSKSPSAVANKLRLLKHSPAVRAALQSHQLSERHARALLRLSDEEEKLRVIELIVKRELTVARTEAYIDQLLTQPRHSPKPRKLLLKDLRLFLNSVDRHLETLKQAGIAAGIRREETEQEIVLTIHLPKQQKTAQPPCETEGFVL